MLPALRLRWIIGSMSGPHRPGPRRNEMKEEPVSFANLKVTLASRPSGTPVAANFALLEESTGAPAPGHVVVKADALGIDAFIRTALDEGSFHQTVPIGGVITALGVGQVAASGDSALPVGAWVFGPLGAQAYATLPAAMLRPLDPAVAPPRAYLGALGMTTGLTAYFGIVEVGKVQPAETVVVSAAAGAVGSIASQVAKALGARVIGIAGGPAKCAFLVQELGLDGAIDYKNEDVDARLRELAPAGIDVFFDNVGGAILDAVLLQVRERARVVLCGGISNYDHMGAVRGPSNYLKLAERYARMEGFTVMHFAHQFPDAERQLAAWMNEGIVTMPEQIMNGIESFPAAIISLMTGGNTGKLLVVPA